MASCDYCDTTILFGGVSDGELRFCNDKCHQRGYVVSVAGALPDAELHQMVQEVHNGACPVCEGRGPVDVHKAHKVWSALLMTSWSSDPYVCCRSCGVKRQAGGLLYSLFLGWWGFPWGLIMTPVQIGRNLVGMAKAPDPLQPSQDLHEAVRFDIAAQILNEQQKEEQLGQPIEPA